MALPKDLVELRIRDLQPEKTLISLADLLRRIEEVQPDTLTGRWRLEGIDGYGEHVVSWSGQTEQEPIEIAADDLFPVLLDGDEYIEDGTLSKLSDAIEVGVDDSAFLFLRAPAELTDQIAPFFTETEVVSATW